MVGHYDECGYESTTLIKCAGDFLADDVTDSEVVQEWQPLSKCAGDVVVCCSRVYVSPFHGFILYDLGWFSSSELGAVRFGNKFPKHRKHPTISIGVDNPLTSLIRRQIFLFESTKHCVISLVYPWANAFLFNSVEAFLEF